MTHIVAWFVLDCAGVDVLSIVPLGTLSSFDLRHFDAACTYLLCLTAPFISCTILGTAAILLCREAHYFIVLQSTLYIFYVLVWAQWIGYKIMPCVGTCMLARSLLTIAGTDILFLHGFSATCLAAQIIVQVFAPHDYVLCATGYGYVCYFMPL